MLQYFFSENFNTSVSADNVLKNNLEKEKNLENLEKTRFRVQYDQCFPSFSYFVNLFCPYVSKITKTRKTLVILREIIS